MTREEALEWLKGNRSMVNTIYGSNPLQATEAEVAKADAYMIMQAYYITKAWEENLIPKENPYFYCCCPSCYGKEIIK